LLVDELLLAMVTVPQVRGGGGQGEQRRPEIEEVGMAARQRAPPQHASPPQPRADNGRRGGRTVG
jgi:hypothetical protein